MTDEFNIQSELNNYHETTDREYPLYQDFDQSFISQVYKAHTIEMFQSQLTPEKIISFQQRFKDEKSGKISKKRFLKSMSELFPLKYAENSSQKNLYENLFNRFKSVNCAYINKEGYYYITNIIQDEEINLYEITIVLIIFMKCDYKTKIRLLFNLSDKDEDGLLNELEISKLIFSIHTIFSEEGTPINTNSTVLNHSLSSVKANQAMNQLLYHPGYLRHSLRDENCVDFDTFYKALTKIENYQFYIIPCIVNIRSSLDNQRKEKKLIVNRNLKDDYFTITNEILMPIHNFKKVDKNSFVKEGGFGFLSERNSSTKRFRLDFKLKPKLSSNSNNFLSTNNNNNTNLNNSSKENNLTNSLSSFNILTSKKNNNNNKCTKSPNNNNNLNFKNKNFYRCCSCSTLENILNLNSFTNTSNLHPFVFDFEDKNKKKDEISILHKGYKFSVKKKDSSNKVYYPLIIKSKNEVNQNKGKFKIFNNHSTHNIFKKGRYLSYNQMIQEVDYLNNKDKREKDVFTDLRELEKGLICESKRTIDKLNDDVPKVMNEKMFQSLYKYKDKNIKSDF